jgi:hypothetical protein
MPPNPVAHPTKTPPQAFGQCNQVRSQRVVRLTEKALAQLESTYQPVTLAALARLTYTLDCEGKGISERTILRNPAAVALFRSHSLAYQARQQTVNKTRRKRAAVRTTADVRAAYRGLRAADLIPVVEELKATIAELKAQHEKLQAERTIAYRLRDEALQHNARQLAALAVMTKTQGPPKKP